MTLTVRALCQHRHWHFEAESDLAGGGSGSRRQVLLLNALPHTMSAGEREPAGRQVLLAAAAGQAPLKRANSLHRKAFIVSREVP